MSNTVTYRGHRDRADGTTDVQVEVDNKTWTFAKGVLVPDVPRPVVDRLGGDDLKGHRFDVESAADADTPEPFEGYDQLSADDVVTRLADLSDEQVEAVKAYESAHKDRKTITGYERA